MALDLYLVERLRKLLVEKSIQFEEKKMFGGIAFMVNTHMTVGVTNKNDLMVRCSKEKNAELLKLDGAGPMMFTGKPMSGFLFITLEAVDTDKLLSFWVDQGLDFALNTPPKKK
jgi:hypothetical protein